MIVIDHLSFVTRPGEKPDVDVAITRVGFLGDVLVIPKDYPLANVISVGDIVLAVGALLLMQRIMRLESPADADADADAAGDTSTSTSTSA